MQDLQLNRLLIEIDMLSDEKYFHGTLTNVKVNAKSQTWAFTLTLKEALPYEIYERFLSKIEERFLSDIVQNVEVVIEYPDLEFEFSTVLDYYRSILEKYFPACMEKNLLLNRKHHYSAHNNLLSILVYNEIEASTIEKHFTEIEKLFINCGFNLVFETIVEEKEVQKDITEELAEIPAYELKASSVESNVKSDSELLFGKRISDKKTSISDLEMNMSNVMIEAELFDVEIRKLKNDSYLCIFKLTDGIDSISAKTFVNEDAKELEALLSLKKGTWLQVGGKVVFDQYDNCETLRIYAIRKSNYVMEKDNSEKKRVELHVHTNMSTLDGIINPKDLIAFAKYNGYEAVGVVDHNNLQAFPDLYNAAKNSGVKVLYGCEMNVIHDSIDLTFNSIVNQGLNEATFVVFDFETTGFNAHLGDKIIEFGACKLKNGEIIDTFSELADPQQKLRTVITEVTGIRDSDLSGKRTEEEVFTDFIKWIGNDILVAHNAKFDFSFLKNGAKKYLTGEFDNMIVDTLALSRALHPEWGRHGLAALTKRYKITLDNHHRALDDAIATAKLFSHQITELLNLNIVSTANIGEVISVEEMYKYSSSFHVTALAKNNNGLKDLFQLVSLMNTEYFHKTPLLPRSEINRLRDNLLIGSSCVNNEIMQAALKFDKEKLKELISFYDYLEIQPPSALTHLIDREEVHSNVDIIKALKLIIEVGEEFDKIVCVTGDVHYLSKKDKRVREIIIHNPMVGGGFHPLSHRSITKLPDQHFYTTNEMLQQFDFLDNPKKYVIDNPLKIAAQIEEVEVIKKDLYTPKQENSAALVKELVYSKAKSIYSETLPQIVTDRIEKELASIIGHSFDVIYYISHLMVKKSLEDGYIVGSRGSVGSSFIATLLDITEVNPLSPHYQCPNCKYSEFINEGYDSGYDLPSKNCPVCETPLKGDGHTIPFETFLGFDGDKVPDIDLNFSGDYQNTAHDYTKELFGKDNVFRAGTISTLAEKTAYGYVKGFQNDKRLTLSPTHVDYLVSKCQGVKRSTGQHPGGIIVIPDYMDVYDFTPVQYPADDINASWKTTHFDFHAIHDNILKLDILGHDNPTVILHLQQTSGVNLSEIDYTAEDVISIFRSAEALGISEEKISLSNGEERTLFTSGTLGIPEFGTRFVIEMLKDTQPTSFSQLVKISGLSHGTDVWLNNGQKLVRENTCSFSEIIGCRDDIMIYLVSKNIEQATAFAITEKTRKGKGVSKEHVKIMQDHGVPDWYIESCQKIKYMFPRAHACAYVLDACRIAYYKVREPIHFYAAYFSVRVNDFDIEAMILGEDAVRKRIVEIANKGREASAKEQAVLQTLEISLEMLLRGMSFANISLEKSDAHNFIVDGDQLIPPLRSIDGLGKSVAVSICEQREIASFTSIENLKKRTKLSSTLTEILQKLRVLDHLEESDQLSLF